MKLFGLLFENWPATMTAKELAEFSAKHHWSDIDEEELEHNWFADHIGKLKTVKLSWLKPNHEYDDSIDPERVNAYMEKDPASAPPLICWKDGGIIDAKARGDSTAQAYILYEAV